MGIARAMWEQYRESYWICSLQLMALYTLNLFDWLAPSGFSVAMTGRHQYFLIFLFIYFYSWILNKYGVELINFDFVLFSFFFLFCFFLSSFFLTFFLSFFFLFSFFLFSFFLSVFLLCFFFLLLCFFLSFLFFFLLFFFLSLFLSFFSCFPAYFLSFSSSPFFFFFFFFFFFSIMHNSQNIWRIQKCSTHQMNALLSKIFLFLVRALCELRLTSYGSKHVSWWLSYTPSSV